MIKLSDYLDIPTMRELSQSQTVGKKRSVKRQYQAARTSRLDKNWTSTSTSANYELYTSLRTLRARAREAARNNSHFKKFLGMVRRNVIGPQGIQLQCRAKDKAGKMNRSLNKFIENIFYDWGRKETCSVSGKLSWIDAQNLFVTQLARDGEVLVQKVKTDNKFGFALRFIDVNYLDETYNTVLPNGNRIIMSVELDQFDKPAAYWLTTPTSEYALPRIKTELRKRVDAKDFIHAFLITDDESQVRGLTWFHTALIDAKHLHGYKEGVITSAEAAAYQMGFFIKKADENEEYDEDEDEIYNAPEINVSPLSMNIIDEDYDFKQFDPKQPTQNHAQFYKSILADLATGLEVNYFSLAGDMEAVNLSTARLGLSEERDIWRYIQNFVTEHFLNDVFNEWLNISFLSGLLKISTQELFQLRNPFWRARGWEYMDPAKEVSANREALETNQDSLTDVLAEKGVDILELFESIQNERELAAEFGIELNYSKNPVTHPVDPNQNDQNSG